MKRIRLRPELAHPTQNAKNICRMNGNSNINKNDKRLFEFYILFRIKLLLSAEKKIDEIEKK